MLSETRKLKVIHEDEYWKILCEVIEGIPFLHVYGKNYCFRAAKQAYLILASLQEAFKEKGYKEFRAFSPNHKFCELYGGELLTTALIQGTEYGVYKWELV